MNSPISIDFSALAGLIVSALVAGIEQLVSPLPAATEEWILHAIQGVLSAQGSMNLLTHVPTQWTTRNADVMLLWRGMLPIEAGLGAVVLMIGGYRIMAGQDDIWHVTFRYGFLVMAGEAVIIWADLVLNVVNGMSDFIGAAPADIRSEIMPNDLTLGLMLIVAAFFAGLAWIKGAVGVVFVDVLIVSAPFLLPLSAIPKLQGLAQWWVTEFTTWTLRAVMVALVARLALGIGAVQQGGIQFLFAIVGFWLAYKMDTQIRSFSMGAWGTVGQFGLFTRGARMAAGAFGGGSATHAPAAAAAPATV